MDSDGMVSSECFLLIGDRGNRNQLKERDLSTGMCVRWICFLREAVFQRESTLPTKSAFVGGARGFKMRDGGVTKRRRRRGNERVLGGGWRKWQEGIGNWGLSGTARVPEE
jgi:hypothetical protein